MQIRFSNLRLLSMYCSIAETTHDGGIFNEQFCIKDTSY
jgi:hypothetical protein